MKLLTFLLRGPMQSWGESARWDYRSTTEMPGKSAIIGLLGCCFGYERGDTRLNHLSERLHLAVRCDRSGYPFWDFNTVQNPYGSILNAEGKPRGDTIILNKQYLQDCAFQIFLFGDEELLESCASAMNSPYWTPFLGRKSCPPSIPMIPHIIEYDNIEAALESYFHPSSGNTDEKLFCQIELLPNEQTDDRVITRDDEIVRADRNEYISRRVRAMTVYRREKNVSD